MALVDSRLMPGFRFHPTDEELVMYYLKRKVMGKMTHCAEIISELDIYKYEPSDLPDKACLKSRDLNWYFFCPRRGNKYANGVRANRATEFGYWKATGNDRTVSHNNHTVGKIKTLIFHRGKPPKGNRTDWVIHEYRLDDSTLAAVGVMQDLYVLCKVFHKSGFGPKNGEQYGAPFVEEEWDDDDIKIQCVPASSPPAVKCCDTKNAAGLCDHNVNGNTCAAVSLEVVMCGERVKQQATHTQNTIHLKFKSSVATSHLLLRFYFFPFSVQASVFLRQREWGERERMELVRAKSDKHLTETIAGAAKSPTSIDVGQGGAAHSGSLSRKSSRRMTPASPGRSAGSHRNSAAHIRKSHSAQLRVDPEDLSNAALSRASSASLGLSFSMTGFIMPPDDISDSKTFSDEDDEIPEDLEAGIQRKIEAEPTMPICLKFTDVTYKVILKGVARNEEKEILHGVSGSVNPGEVLALMGPSGSGKTTLLNVLGGRLNQPTPGGSIMYNDLPFSKFLKSRIGFVTQDDVLFPHLTVRETLTYAAFLRLPKTLTRKQKEKRASDVISELGLERCQDTIIGGSFVRGVSGGERKRVCIGNEIIINPSLLLLDEPTSGLDSTTALRIIQMLQDIAEAGKTVITTIHQPSSRLFHKFNKLILLGKGSLLYYGKASDAMLYFSLLGCTPLLAMNPAEFLLDLASGNLNDVTIPSELEDKVQTSGSELGRAKGKPSPAAIHEYLLEAYKSRVAENEKKNIMFPVPINEEDKEKLSYPKREWGATWWQQYSILFWRGIKERKHDYFSWLRISQVLITALILGLLWWQSESKTEDGMRDQIGLLFFLSVFWGFLPVFTAIFTFPQERSMLKKERAADMYRLSAYFIARISSDLPLDLMLPVLFIAIVYFMAGLRLNAGTFFLTVLTIFLEIIAAEGFGLAIGATLMDVKKATTIASVSIMAFMLAGGYFINKVPVFITWLRYLSFNYHTYRLLLKVQYEDDNPTMHMHMMKIDSGVIEIATLAAMIFGYRLWAYIALRRMKLNS